MGDIFRKRHILELLFLLTREERHLSFQGMSRLLLENGRKVSEPTIKSWFTYLQQEPRFTYYPITEFEQFGLTSVTAILRPHASVDPSEDTFLPRRILSTSVFDFSGKKHNILQQYLVDKADASAFRKSLMERGAYCWETKSERVLYNPFHRIFTPDGYFIPYSGRFSDADIQKLTKTPVAQGACHNSLVKWILLDKIQTYKNSHQVWQSIKSNRHVVSDLGEEAVKDSVGIKRVQEALRCNRLKLTHKLNFPPFVKDLRRVFYVGDLSHREVVHLAKLAGQNSFSVSLFQGKPSMVVAHCNIHGLLDLAEFCNARGSAEDTIFLEQGQSRTAQESRDHDRSLICNVQ